jgi:lipoprotein-anchoring transpeptidase ErfK/SrfK
MIGAGGRMSDTVARFRIRGLTRWSCVLALALTLATVALTAEAQAGEAPPVASPPATGPSPAVAPTTRQLSNERTLTTWAHPVEPGPIYAHPEAHARRVGRIHLATEDGFPEVYLLLSVYTDAQGDEWVRLRIPGRPNGRIGWVSREVLAAFHRTRWAIVVNLAERRLTAYNDGHVRMTAPVGVGKPSTPTPTGRFWIRERFTVTDRGNPYWPYALGTSDYSTLTEWPGGGVIGIHGDFGEPQKIPGDPSHGCVRMRDADIAWLGPRVTLGTPVDIVTG